jgi:hypothetical protein
LKKQFSGLGNRSSGQSWDPARKSGLRKQVISQAEGLGFGGRRISLSQAPWLRPGTRWGFSIPLKQVRSKREAWTGQLWEYRIREKGSHEHTLFWCFPYINSFHSLISLPGKSTSTLSRLSLFQKVAPLVRGRDSFKPVFLSTTDSLKVDWWKF